MLYILNRRTIHWRYTYVNTIKVRDYIMIREKYRKKVLE